MKTKLCALFFVSFFIQSIFAADLTIKKSIFNSTLIITSSTNRFAGAIYSVNFRGKEYINSKDHGREFQSASSFDRFGECFNPTEAGRDEDGVGLTSSSVPINYSNSNNVLQTSTNMAFWLAPGKAPNEGCADSGATVAQNTTIVSGHVLEKSVSIGYQGIPNIVRYEANFHVTEAHQQATFEAVAGYMPPDFTEFRIYDPVKRTLSSTLSSASEPMGEQQWPLILATKDGRHAMGITSFDLPHTTSSPFTRGRFYGRFRFPGETSKFNCVFREGAISAGKYTYTCYVAIGTVDEVMAAQNALYASGGQPMPVFRFYNGRDHLLTSTYGEGAGAGYNFEATAFKVYSTNSDGALAMVYRCATNDGDHFISGDPNCESVNIDGPFGFISPSPRAGFTALYRFYKAADRDHLDTTDYQEGVNAGYSYQNTIGYVPVN